MKAKHLLACLTVGTVLVSSLLPVNAATYTIQKGDTLGKIASETGMSVNAIMEANGIKDANKIVAGKTLTLDQLPAQGTSYKSLYDLFDATYYAEKYPDVVSVLGNSKKALYRHFMTYGMKEGRSLSNAFDVNAYKSAYPDLVNAFGDDIAQYYNHFLTFGQKENRTLITKEACVEAGITVSDFNGTVIVSPVVQHYVPQTNHSDSKPAPEPTETPVITKIGNVDATDYNKAEALFTNIVKKMRADGLIDKSDICVVMDSSSIKVDITFNNATTDLVLSKDENKIYTLTLDRDFEWLEGFATTINGIDTALYNKDLLIALLSTMTEDPEIIFETIDRTYHSSYSLSETEWTEVGDYDMRYGKETVPNTFVYEIKKYEIPTDGLYLNVCGNNLLGIPALTKSLGAFTEPLYTLIDNGDGTSTLYMPNNHVGYMNGELINFDVSKSDELRAKLLSEGYRIEYAGGSSWHSCVGGYDEGCIHKYIVSK